MLLNSFFDDDAVQVAKKLLGKVLCVKYHRSWLTAMIIETEAYYLHDKASHSSQGYTEKRKALFMSPGTIYMYYSRAGDSLNVSTRGEGDAVLIKSGIPYFIEGFSARKMLSIMQRLNPAKNSTIPRSVEKLCAGQALLCNALNLKVKQWDQKAFRPEGFYIADVDYRPNDIIQARRLGIPTERDEQLFYRFIDVQYAKCCSSNPLKRKNQCEGIDYFILNDI